MFVLKYRLHLPTKEELMEKLQRECEIIELKNGKRRNDREGG